MMARLSVLRDIHGNSRASQARAYQYFQTDPAIDDFFTNMLLGVEGFDMDNYWLDFLKMVDALIMNVCAVHLRNWEEYLASLREMMPWLLIHDKTNYGRWLPYF